MDIFKNQKILITGGTGMVGIALTKLLLDLEANTDTPSKWAPLQ